MRQVKSQEQTEEVIWNSWQDTVFNGRHSLKTLIFTVPLEILLCDLLTIVLFYSKKVILFFFTIQYVLFFDQSSRQDVEVVWAVRCSQTECFISVCEVAEKLQAACSIWMCCCVSLRNMCVCARTSVSVEVEGLAWLIEGC